MSTHFGLFRFGGTSDAAVELVPGVTPINSGLTGVALQAASGSITAAIRMKSFIATDVWRAEGIVPAMDCRAPLGDLSERIGTNGATQTELGQQQLKGKAKHVRFE